MSNKKKWIAGTIVIVLLTNIITFAGTINYSQYLPLDKAIISKSTFYEVMKFAKMYEIRNVLYKHYDGEIDDNKLVEGAIKGMTDALKDPYTVFMSKDEYKKFTETTEGSYAGIGIQIEPKDNLLKVTAVFDGSPADKAGIKANDAIAKVGGTEITGKDSTKAVSLMKGPAGTDITVTFYRKDKGLFDVKLTRAVINTISVKGEMLQNSLGYIKVDIFDEHVAADFAKKIKDLKDKGMKSLIIDLRENPGGDLAQCIELTSNFVPKDKPIVSTIDKYKKEKVYKSKGGSYSGLPLTVLTDENSASASEIFVGAIRDYKLGTLVGKTTFGKGVVQTLLDTDDGTALKVTISKYYTPSGENIHKIGIKPDVEVEYSDELKKQIYSRETDPQLQKAIEIAKQKIK